MKQDKLHHLFDVRKPVIGMIHLLPLPAAPAYSGNDKEIIQTAIQEAEQYVRAGVDGILIENMHDVPYLKKNVGPEIVAFMAVVAHQIKQCTSVPCGVQILAGANKAALGVAKAADLDFVRAEGFVYGHMADEGYMDACAGELLRYRKAIDAENVAVFTDIKKKHSAHALTADIDLLQTAEAAAYFRSDGIIITGTSTARPAPVEVYARIHEQCQLPVIAGSGVDIDNVLNHIPYCDALIVGSYFKKDGKWFNTVDYDRTAAFMEKVTEWRGEL